MGYLFRIHSVSSDNHDPIIKPMQPGFSAASVRVSFSLPGNSPAI